MSQSKPNTTVHRLGNEENYPDEQSEAVAEVGRRWYEEAESVFTYSSNGGIEVVFPEGWTGRIRQWQAPDGYEMDSFKVREDGRAEATFTPEDDA